MKPNSGKLAVAGVLGTFILFAGVHAAEPANLEQANKDMKIMSNIFQTVLEDESGNGRMALRQQPTARYLAGQGMLFTFDMQSMQSFWPVSLFQGANGGQNVQQLEQQAAQLGQQAAQISQEVMERMQEAFGNMDFSFDYDYDYDYDYDFDVDLDIDRNYGRTVLRLDPSLTQQQRDMMERLVADIRAHEEDVQELQRSMREVQRAQRQANDDGELESRIEDMEDELQLLLEGLNEKHTALSAYQQELETQRQARVNETNLRLAERIIEGLCDYGSTIRSLGNDEHISLIFENVSEASDRVYIFEYRDVAECTSAESLRSQAVSYLL